MWGSRLDGVAVRHQSVEPRRRSGAGRRADRVEDAVGQPALVLGLRGHPRPTVGAEHGRHGAEAGEGGDVLEPGPAGPLLVAADEQRRQAQAPPHQQRPHARRAHRACGR